MIEQTFALEELGVSAYVLWVSGEVHLHLWVCASVQHGLLLCRPEGVPLRDGVCFSGRLALGLVRGFLDFAHYLILKFSKAPDLLLGSRGDGHGARLLVDFALAWLHVAYSPLSARTVLLLTSIVVGAPVHSRVGGVEGGDARHRCFW